jgi:hypothetical protein
MSRASTSFCCAVCGTGKYSSLDTICVGTGEGNDADSAGSNPLINPSSMNFIAASHWGLLPSSLRTMAAFREGHGTLPRMLALRGSAFRRWRSFRSSPFLLITSGVCCFRSH